MLKKILQHDLLVKKPPVVIDLGASGESYKAWNQIYPFSIFLALDGDKRKKTSYKNKFKKYISINKIVDVKKRKKKFFLTKSPFCSSILKPSTKKTEEWFFHNQFKILKQLNIKTITLNQILKENKIEYIDFLKIDLQGIDLDIFKNITPKIKKRIKFVDIEPSLYGFYEGENNNTPETLKYMQKEFDVEDIKFGKHVKGNIKNINNLTNIKKKLIYFINKKSISYLNISFLKKFKKDNFNERDLLIYLYILLLTKRYAEVFSILKKINSKDIIFTEIKKYCELKIKLSFFKYIFYLPFILIKNIIRQF